MFLVTGLYHLHRVVSSGHSKVVLDQFCPRGERKLKKVDQIYWTESYKAASAFHSKQLFWLASPPLWLLGASQRRPRPTCCLCRWHQPWQIRSENRLDLFLLVFKSDQNRGLICFCWFSNQIIRKESQFIFVDFQINFQISLHSQPGSLCRKSSLDWIHPEKKEPWLEIRMNPIVPGR